MGNGGRDFLRGDGKGVNLEKWEDEGRDWGEVREGKL